jgi:diguanylate cyclase (GGDEF)-like protein/PAS domain S-box-containing protein
LDSLRSRSISRCYIGGCLLLVSVIQSVVVAAAFRVFAMKSLSPSEVTALAGSAGVLTAASLWIGVGHRIAKALGRSAAVAAELMNAAPEGILGVDANGSILFANSQVQRLFQYPQTELVGQSIEILIPDRLKMQHKDRRADYARRAQTRPMGSGLTIVGRRYDGTEFPADVSLSRVSTDGRSIVLCIVRDVTDQKRAQDELRDANKRLEVGLAENERRAIQLRQLTEMGEFLEGCHTEAQAHAVLERYLNSLLPGVSGALYLIDSSRSSAEAVAVWGMRQTPMTMVFAPDDCWALRRGRLHCVGANDDALRCGHCSPAPMQVCVPMVAQGDALGVLHVSTANERESESSLISHQLLQAVAEHIGLAMANIRLREALKSQSILDPLTGLYNRRFMEEWLEREIRRAARAGDALSVLVLDLDNFKRFNDTFGHEAGDLVLREVGGALRRNVRASDIACRLGGEELTVLLAETSIQDAVRIADTIRAAVERLVTLHRGQPIGQVTASIGVAAYPQSGLTVRELLAAADAALYRAKSGGRNCVVTAVENSDAIPRTLRLARGPDRA